MSTLTERRREAMGSTESSPGLLEVERFPPPEAFREQALLKDPAVYERAAADPAGVVGRAGRAAALVQPLGAGARRLEPSVLQVVHRRQAQRLLQLPGPPRGGRPRRAPRLPLARRGRHRARHHLRRAARRGQALRQRAEGPRRRQGRRRRDLPADDPRGRRRDARLRAHRRASQRRVRRLLRRGGPRADGVLRGEGADHRRRRLPQGHDGSGEGARRRGDGRSRDAREDRRRAKQGARLRDEGGPRPSTTTRSLPRPTPSARRRSSTPSTRSTSSTRPARPRSRRGSCTRRAAI